MLQRVEVQRQERELALGTCSCTIKRRRFALSFQLCLTLLVGALVNPPVCSGGAPPAQKLACVLVK